MTTCIATIATGRS